MSREWQNGQESGLAPSTGQLLLAESIHRPVIYDTLSGPDAGKHLSRTLDSARLQVVVRFENVILPQISMITSCFEQVSWHHICKDISSLMRSST